MAENLKVRQREILKLLMTSGIPLDVGFFKQRFNKSERTIRYDINELKEQCAKYGVEIRYQTRRGFFIPASQKIQCSKILVSVKYQVGKEFYVGSDGEKYKTLFLYFFSQNKKLTIDQVAEKLYISRSTLVRFVSGFNRHFGDDVQVIPKKSGGYELRGDELKMRRMAVAFISEKLKGGHAPEEWFVRLPEPVKDYAGQRKMAMISNGIKKINARHNIWISDQVFLKLLSYCIVADIRCRRNGREGIIVNEGRGYAYELLNDLASANESIEKKELDYLIEILEEESIMINLQVQDEEKLTRALRETGELLREADPKKYQSYDLEMLYHELLDHLRNFLHLWILRQEPKEENYAMIREVRENYYEFYRIAIKIARTLENRLEVVFSDTEVCYIAVYLYKNYREKITHKKKALVVCATGKGLSNLLTIRLENVFPTIEVIGQISPYQFSDPKYYQKADFIFSTIPLKNSKIPVVRVSRILSSEDIMRIQEFLDSGEPDVPDDPFTLSEGNLSFDRKNMEDAVNILSKLILTMLEYTSRLPAAYTLSQDALLGLIIHMSMAISRWFKERSSTHSDEESIREYERILAQHPEVIELMEQFFELIERSLMVSIAIDEKIAFYLYIIKEEE